jgi:hypothetical protein
MDNFLLRSIEEHSVLWVVISAGVGGVIGAFLKYLFETVFASRYQHKITARLMLRKYRFPLLRAADSLDRRLQNMIQFIKRNWYEDPNNDYYRLSTLYLFGSYLSWGKILEDVAFLEFETSNRKAREFSIHFYRVFKTLTGFYYFSGLDDGEIEGVEEATVPHLALTAMAELMIQRFSQDKKEMPNILGFVEFAKRMKESPEFQKWFGYLENGILKNHSPSKSSARWNRLLVVATMLRSFVTFLDPKSRQTSPRQIRYLKMINPKVAEKVREELVEMKMEGLIVS